ncbi:beta-propeller domain-containing protein [Yinghuangia soli]|uniref:Beta-propeller domain-containing protein n=1 Tax=Yinghuangia soli TaxID=2908204 RepID=A0AA41PVK1_9ACTN|nr:beta-propeller domain-containing protein [Yinghuangia soli]MCF2525981.1 beta-propeller domain-containing protein [Yinghuangia soli]
MRIDDGTLGPAGTPPGRPPVLSGRRTRGQALAALLLCGGLVAAGCTSSDKPDASPGATTPVPGGTSTLTGEAGAIRAKMMRLSTYNSCDALLTDFRKAALARSKQTFLESGDMAAAAPAMPGAAPPGSGFTGGGTTGGERSLQQDAAGKSGAGAAEAPAAAAPNGGTQPSGAPGYSGTNTHEQGVDEPDLVKTDGKRLLTVADGTLRVFDAAGRTQTGKLALPGGRASEMLLSGDRALLILPGGNVAYDGGPGMPVPMPGDATTRSSKDAMGPDRARMVLVDISGAPRILGELAVDGGYVDARQIGTTARVVVRSFPRVPVPENFKGDYQKAYETAVGKTTVDNWLPAYTLTSGGQSSSGRLVDCNAVSRPDTEPGAPGHSGASTLSVLSFDLTRDLGTGSPVTVAADADTVYASASNLYVASNYYTVPGTSRQSMVMTPPRTAIYQFDISGSGQPKHVASGDVEGTLLNQYSLSEYDKHLRVATTAQIFAPPPSAQGTTGSVSTSTGGSGKDKSTGTGVKPGRGPAGAAERIAPVPTSTESAVTVLERKGGDLVQVGRAGGLGRGERIYAVRFVGPVGYVVTFRQTDPLYTLDLAVPTAPKVLGELKINGYSAYLHPLEGGKLIGVGQDATDTGRRTGTQVSLFDVANLADPKRIANYTVAMGNSEAEMDPHAFLYWPATGILVIPLQTVGAPGSGSASNGSSTGGSTGGSGPAQIAPDRAYAPSSQALVLKLQGGSFTEVGKIQHPGGYSQMRRSVVIGDDLWTVSTKGVMVNGLGDLAQRAWVPFS